MWGLVRIVRLRQQAGELTIMPHTIDPSRDLLFGLLALQTGLINQAQLVAAFHLWTQASDRPMSTILAELDALDTPSLALVERLVIEHLRRHGNDPERSLAAVCVGRSTRECLAQIGNPDLNTSLAHAGLGSTADESDSDRTPRYSVGTATSDGQRFRVLRPHAQGGLGAVFVALDTELHREVALKQILDDHADDPASRQRFLVEAEITGGLEHPGIVPVYGLGNYGDGRPYYAMRFIRGDSLKEAIERFRADAALQTDPGRRSLELRKLLRRFIDVCNAVDYAHSRGVLHRDIKPGNVMVGKYGETLIVDWGLATRRLSSTEATWLGPTAPPVRLTEQCRSWSRFSTGSGRAPARTIPIPGRPSSSWLTRRPPHSRGPGPARKESDPATELGRGRAGSPRMPGDPGEGPARRLEHLQHPLATGRQPVGSGTVRRGRATDPHGLRGPQGSRGQDPRAGQGSTA
jgi:tRNA A-37 threonylcarbamoyl transferase component Bud32